MSTVPKPSPSCRCDALAAEIAALRKDLRQVLEVCATVSGTVHGVKPLPPRPSLRVLKGGAA